MREQSSHENNRREGSGCDDGEEKCSDKSMALEAGIRVPASSLAIDGRDLFRGETGGENDLEHLDVFAVAKFAMTDIRRLMDA